MFNFLVRVFVVCVIFGLFMHEASAKGSSSGSHSSGSHAKGSTGVHHAPGVHKAVTAHKPRPVK